ncbi:MAG: hypothetical protein IJZ36_05015 [Bacilli bacterium]|nr:hypothetical protein [Bacilli bacterium]
MKKLLVRAMLIVMMVVKAYHVDIIELPQEDLFVVDNEEDREVLEEAYAKLPEEVKEAFEAEHGQIVLLPADTDLPEYLGDKVSDDVKEYNNKTNGKIIGKYENTTDKIYIVNTNKEEVQSTLIHEMGHFVGDNGSVIDKLMLVDVNHYTDEWQETWVNEGQYASSYAALSDAEGFAEGFKFMVIEEDRYELWYPQSYAYIQECINNL